jgi:hypothetical protein
MTTRKRKGQVSSAPILVLGLVCFFLVFGGPVPAFSQKGQTAAAAPAGPDPWPKSADVNGTRFTVYQPQLDTWDGYRFEAHAAVSVLPPGITEPVFGVIQVTASTLVDRRSRTVQFKDLKVEKTTFPSDPYSGTRYQPGFQSLLASRVSNIPLDRLETALAIEKAEKRSRTVPVQNEPPQFVFSPKAAVLVAIDGDPVWRPVENSNLTRVLNTRALILKDPAGRIYLHLFDGFLAATSLSGPWTSVKKPPATAVQAAKSLAQANAVDLMEGPPDEKTGKKPSLSTLVPEIVTATRPTELIVTDGPPDWVPIQTTALLFLKNTTGNVFKNLNDQQTYVLVTGRWFRSADFKGPWQYVPATALPADFAGIPDDSPKENVKASVPGTRQAREAIIANDIPQTAQVDRTQARFQPQISGNPELKPIPEAGLSYVSNSPTPIIMVSPTSWYAVQSGVWFTGTSVQGPWVVATSVPSAVYAIPPSSPVYYATYVKIYQVTPQYVTVGYTYGYMGTVVTTDGVVVYGTGYYYAPYIGPTAWVPVPVTYGYAANPSWTPWTGWAVGFGVGWAFGAAMVGSRGCWGYAPAPYWGPMPYAYHGAAYGHRGGAAAWGPGGWAATTGNVYQRWGPTTAVSRSSAGYNAWTGNAWSSKVGTSYNSVTGRVSAGQRASVSNVYTGGYASGQRGATYNPNTGVSARGGSATVGNAYSGSQTTARGVQVSGPGGQSASAAKVGNNVYAGHDGNVYKNTGSGWEQKTSGGWSNVQNSGQVQSLQSQQQARQAGQQRSAASSSRGAWGGGFSGSRPSGGRGGRRR